MSDFDPDKTGGRVDDESGIARVLRAAGGRAKPAERMKEAVRAVVHAEWRATVAKRSQRRAWLALAASVTVAALALWVGRVYLMGPGELVASVVRSVGTVHSPSSQLHAGEDLRTGPDGRVALQLRDGVSLRLDYNTRIAFVDAGRIDVKSGAVYVDAGATPGAFEHLRLGTPAGIVQHVGTQYEARILDAGTRVRVREGRVDVKPEHGSVQSAVVGEQLLVTPTGTVQRDAIAPSDPQWDWAASTAPAFDINGRPVRDFLSWAGRELGREIVFANAESEAEAARAVLSGSVAGLTPAEALAAVLPTTPLRSADHDGKLEISLQ